MMELYASGFNASNQLHFNPDENSATEPNDIVKFTKVLHGEELEKPIARLSQTAVVKNGSLLVAGLHTPTRNISALHSSAYAGNGEELHISETHDSPSPRVLRLRAAKDGNCSTNNQQSLNSATSAPPKQLAAFESGFAILYEDGTVETLGDPRYPECLGRDVTSESPADEPGRVTELEGLGDPVRQICAGGYTLAALTVGGSIYIWGRQNPGTPNRGPAFADLQAFPNYIEVDGDKDVKDFGLGDSHAIALTADGSVYVVGDNGNGQLGIQDVACTVWTKLDFAPPPGHDVVGVAAGPRSSFILTKSQAL